MQDLPVGALALLTILNVYDLNQLPTFTNNIK